MSYFVELDSVDPPWEGRVGPFATKELGAEWASNFCRTGSYEIVVLTSPDDVFVDVAAF